MKSLIIISILVLATTIVAADKKKDTQALLEKQGTAAELRDFKGVPLTDYAEYIADRYDVQIRIDAESMRKAGQKLASEISLAIPRTKRVRLATHLNIVLDQFSLEHTVADDGAVVITAGKKKSLIASLPKTDATFSKRLQEKVKLDRDFGQVPIIDLMAYLFDLTDANSIIDHRSFKKDEKIGEKRIDLKKGEHTIESLFRDVAKQTGCHMHVCDNVIILSAEKPEKPKS